MFPSMNNSYPLFFNQPPSFTTSLETNNISYQNHQELYDNNYLIPTNNINIIPQNLENPINTLIQLENPLFKLENSITNPTTIRVGGGKRDRHTKICTAQGVRDRRVRLSINIAREFFNLQDMLGFDKASKTLGWLLEKSKDAIEELNGTANNNMSSNNNSNNLDAPNIEEDDNEDDHVGELKDFGKTATIKKKRIERTGYKYDERCVEKAVRRSRRANARERARERTKNKKITIVNQNYHQLQVQQIDDQQSLIFNQLISGFRPGNLMPYGVNVGESIVIKSKSSSKDSSHNNNNNNNYEMLSKDYDLGYNNYYHNDHINDGIIHIPGSSSALNIINLSKEIHSNEKQWEIYNNQKFH